MNTDLAIRDAVPLLLCLDPIRDATWPFDARAEFRNRGMPKP
jgi:hypothetical protein